MSMNLSDCTTVASCVYLITHKETGQFYYGSRLGRYKTNRPICNDIWTKYFSSSNVLKSMIEFDGIECFEVKIVMVSDNYSECYAEEHRLIKMHIDNHNCLNLHYVDLDSGKKQWSSAGIKRSDQAIKNYLEYYANHPEVIEKKKKFMQDRWASLTDIERDQLVQNINNGVRNFWDNAKEIRKRISDNKLALYKKHPELLEKIAAAIKQAHIDNPEIRRKISKSLKEHFVKNPDAREKASVRMKQQLESYTPEEKQKIRDKIVKRKKESWDNTPQQRKDEIANKRRESIREFYKNNPEYRRIRSEKMKATRAAESPEKRAAREAKRAATVAAKLK